MCFLGGCSAAGSSDSEAEVFNTEEEALEDFSEGVHGEILIIHTTSGDQLMVANRVQDNFHIGESFKTDGGYAAVRLTTGISLHDTSSTEGTTTSQDGNEYAIIITDEQEEQAVPFAENWYVSVMKAGDSSEESDDGTLYHGENAIESVEVLD